MERDILVAVWMVTYNHEKFIGQAIESVLNQMTTFDFRLFIGEDCSLDTTGEICESYKRKSPEKITLIRNPKNIGATKNGVTMYRLCVESGAKYIATLEGDDYWTDTFKLQKQVDFLESTSQISGCYHDVIIVDENSKLVNENYYHPPKDVFDQRDCLIHGGSYATCSLIFHSSVYRKLPEWYLKSSNDYTLDLLITEFGGIAHLPETMGAYRIHKGGIWQGNKEHKNWEDVIKRYQVCLTNPKFKKEYGGFFYQQISTLSKKVKLHYRHENNFFQQAKYALLDQYYSRLPLWIYYRNYFKKRLQLWYERIV